MTSTSLRAAALLLAVLAVPASAQETPRPALNLYEWISSAPLVVSGQVLGDDGRFTEVEVRAVVKGTAPAGRIVRVDRRQANQERVSGEPVLQLAEGGTYLLLLEPAPEKKREDDVPEFLLSRGTAGARPVPREGGQALVDAARRLGELQTASQGGAFLAWSEFTILLEDPNPHLVQTALDLFLKFRRSDPQVLPSLEPLLDHPRANVRASAAELIGLVLSRHGESAAGAEGSFAALAAHARRDPVVEVRAAAARALGGLSGPRSEEVLKEIAAADPEQAVRYAARRILYERSLGSGPRAD